MNVDRSEVAMVDLLRPPDVRRMLGVSIYQLDRLVEAGKIRRVTLYGTTRRYLAEDVHGLLAALLETVMGLTIPLLRVCAAAGAAVLLAEAGLSSRASRITMPTSRASTAECLNEHWFLSLGHARQIVEAWRLDYNTGRPHSALGNVSSTEFEQRTLDRAPSPIRTS